MKTTFNVTIETDKCDDPETRERIATGLALLAGSQRVSLTDAAPEPPAPASPEPAPTPPRPSRVGHIVTGKAVWFEGDHNVRVYLNVAKGRWERERVEATSVEMARECAARNLAAGVQDITLVEVVETEIERIVPIKF